MSNTVCFASREGQTYDGRYRAQMTDVQCARALRAMDRVACQRGASKVSVADVVNEAGVSRRTFYELFTSGECEEQPLAARVLLVESSAGGQSLVDRRSRIQKRLIAIVDEGRKGISKSAQPDPLTAEGIVGALSSVLTARLTGIGTSNGKRPDLLSLTSSLTSMIVLPYLGTAAANREAKRPAPKRAARSSTPEQADGSLELREAGMRLTYRTVRVLIAIDQNPDGSNRLVGETAGMTDQGQISKLLARLQRIGLIENTHRYPFKGASNSWMLTERGRLIVQSIRANTEGADSHEGSER